jgi:hypothetical protein
MSVPNVIVSPPSGFFNNSTLVAMSGSNITVPLQDYVTGDSGDGTYEVNFVSDVNAVFGTGPSAPGVICTKSAGPFPGLPYDPRVLKGYQFQVVNNAVIGNIDNRLVGGVQTDNIIPGTVSIANDTDVDLTGLADGDVLIYNASAMKWKVSATALQSVRAPSNFQFHYAFVTGTLTNLTAEDGTTLLTAEDGTTQLLDESIVGYSMNWWTDNGAAGNITLRLPNATTPTASKSGSSGSPNNYNPGGTSDVYLIAYAVFSGTWAITITLQTTAPTDADIAPAYAAGVVTLVGVLGAAALVGTLGSSSSGVIYGGAGSGLAA